MDISSLRNGYNRLDSDQKNILQATECSFVLALILLIFHETPDEFFLKYLFISYGITYAFSWRNRTQYSKKRLRSKNGKTFSLKESNKYWLFLFIITPLIFFITGPLIRLIYPTLDAAYSMFGMAFLQMLCSRIYLFRKKIPLRAFALALKLNGSKKFAIDRDYFSPLPNPSNFWGRTGPFKRQ